MIRTVAIIGPDSTPEDRQALIEGLHAMTPYVAVLACDRWTDPDALQERLQDSFPLPPHKGGQR